MMSSLDLKSVIQHAVQTISEVKIEGQPTELYEPINYMLQLGGKRLRPALVNIGGKAYGADYSVTDPLAKAVEVFHNFTLIHDDIMDEAPLRRGKETVHEKWNENLAILSGDVMMIKVYDYILEGNYKQLSQIMTTMNRVAIEVCEGQQMDMNFETRDKVAVEEYIEMIKLKTSVLVGGALQLGALAAEAPEEEAQKLYEFGVNMGIAFQLMDDYLDAFGDPEKFGKQVGGDIIANKKTFLSIRALEEDSSGEMNKWMKSSGEDLEEKIGAVKSIYKANGIDQECLDLMNQYNDKALVSLESATCSDDSKKLLSDFAAWLMNRNH